MEAPKIFGTLANGKTVQEFVLKNNRGFSAAIITYGGIVRELHVPAPNGESADVVLGFDTLSDYVESNPHFGTLTGRVANRIARGTFELDGKTYHLAINNGPNHLHGGPLGFDKAVWEVTGFSQGRDEASLALRHVSPDGDEGYPGALTISVVYTITSENALKIVYDADTTKATPLNLTSHGYFNLAGKGNALGHILRLSADAYTPSDSTLIPTGEIRPVAGTPFDFRTAKKIGAEIGAVDGGYDHNFVINAGGTNLVPVARVEEPVSGRVMEVLSTEPGVQLYTGNFLDGSLKGKDGERYAKHAGFCLETQHFPDAVHHANFPSIILRPAAHFHSETIYRFPGG